MFPVMLLTDIVIKLQTHATKTTLRRLSIDGATSSLPFWPSDVDLAHFAVRCYV